MSDYESDAIKGFREREPLNFEAAERASGFVARSGYPGEPGPESWGEQVFPRYLAGSGFSSAPSSLSLWTDLESLMAFSYFGLHAEALKNARRWNVKQSWPAMVLFWVPAGQRPSWAEAVERFEALADLGPNPAGFSFRSAFNQSGEPAHVDHARVKELVQLNAEGQGDLVERLRTLTT